MSWECSCPNEGVLEPGGAGARTGCRAPELAANSPEFAALEPKGLLPIDSRLSAISPQTADRMNTQPNEPLTV